VLTEILHLGPEKIERLEREVAIASDPTQGFDIN
jgi:hypothetical protein